MTEADDTPVLSALAEITAVSIARGTLPAREHMLVRLAALVAVHAPAASYVVNAGTAADVGITLEDVQGLLVAIAPIVGTPQVVTAAANITRALGFMIDLAIAEAEAEAEADAADDA
jgi:alkylhydroperoxidase/carboxymuconolactone decarboxylase family protein YurZ